MNQKPNETSIGAPPESLHCHVIHNGDTPTLMHPWGSITWMDSARIPATFPATQLVAPRKVVFAAPDGMQIHAQLFERAFLVARMDDGDDQWGAGDVTGRDAKLDRLADPGRRVERGDDRRAGVGALGLHDPTLGRSRPGFIA